MFENATWICLEYGHNAPWFGTVFENEDTPAFLDDPAYAHREYGSIPFRRAFTLKDKPTCAHLAICGLGFYEVRVNGKMPDENRVLTPLVSDYFRYTRYDTYDVSGLLREGENVILVEVCGGWFTGRENFWGWQQIFYGNPRLIAELTLTMPDGTRETVVTDTKNWRVTRGPVTRSCIYDGETIDLNLVPENAGFPTYDDTAWARPETAQAPTDTLLESYAPPQRIVRRIGHVRVQKFTETCFVYDFGENGSGVAELTVTGKKGDTVTLNFSEYVNEDGTLNELSCQGGGSVNTDVFTLTGGPHDVCRPRFTWHGFRYCRVTLSSPDVRVEKIEKLEIHSDLAVTGHFECSDPELNRLHKAYAKTQISCLMGSPLDCNQRGERKGWLGDAGVSAEEAIYNFDMRALYDSFLNDMVLERHPTRKTVGVICPNHKSLFDNTTIDWNLAYPIILTESYARYGDLSLLERHWDSLLDHVGYYDSLRLPDGTIPARFTGPDGKEVTPCWFGDWYTEDKPNGQERVAFACGPEDHRQNPGFLGSVIYAWMLRLVEKIARVLGHVEIADRYGAMHGETVRGIRAAHYHKDTHTLGAGGQFLQTIALAESIVPEEERDAAFAELVKSFESVGWHSYMGVFGVRLIGEVMRDFGREDLLFRILTVRGYPGMMHMIERGQTTVAENLTGGDNDVWGSGCHCMFASPDTNLHRIFGGITVDRFSSPAITIRPFCADGLTYAEDRQDVAEGTVSVRWERTGDGIRFDVTIPDGLDAHLLLEGRNGSLDKTLPGGTYSFTL